MSHSDDDYIYEIPAEMHDRSVPWNWLPMADKRNECDCDRECTTTKHECEKPCIWPECLTDLESLQLVAYVDRWWELDGSGDLEVP